MVQTASSTVMLTLAAWLPSGWVVPQEDEWTITPVSWWFTETLKESGYLHLQATKPDTIGNTGIITLS